jgi:hypothetical protein
MMVQYLSVLRNLLLRPRVFFKLLEDRITLDFAIGFGLISHWIGVIFQFLIGYFFPSYDLSSSFLSTWGILGSEEVLLLKLAWVILDPFLVLGFVLFMGTFVLIGGKLLIPVASQRDLSYRSILKILFLGLGPSVLGFFPGFGIFLSKMGSFMVSFFGVREKYSLGAWRTLGVLIFPRLLFVAVCSAGVLLLPALLLKFILMQSFG